MKTWDLEQETIGQ